MSDKKKLIHLSWRTIEDDLTPSLLHHITEDWFTMSEEEVAHWINELRDVVLNISDVPRYREAEFVNASIRDNSALKVISATKYDDLTDDEFIIVNACAFYRYIASAGIKMTKIYRKFEDWVKDSHLSSQVVCKVYDKCYPDENSRRWDFALHDINDDHIIALVDIVPEAKNIGNPDYWEFLGKLPDSHKPSDKVPVNEDGIKTFLIRQSDFTKDFEEMLKNVFKSYDEYVTENLKKFHAMPFPFPSYTDEQMIKSYQSLMDLDTEVARKSIITDNRIPVVSAYGYEIIRNFHKSIWYSRLDGCMSPYEAWYDEQKLLETIKNRMIFQKDLSPKKILQGFNVSKIAPKVTVFSPARAKLIINDYLSDFDIIFDPLSMFSGRMLAAISLGKKYIGVAISKQMLLESNAIIEFLKKYFTFDAQVVNVGDTNISKEYPCLFTRPLHGYKELYPHAMFESRSCDEWIDVYMGAFKCKRYVFVVDKTENYKDYIKEEVITKSHLYTSNEKIIVIDK